MKSTSDRQRARHNTQTAAQCTELWLVGTPAEIAILTRAARRSTALVYRSAPQPMGGDDPRIRVYLRLKPHR